MTLVESPFTERSGVTAIAPRDHAGTGAQLITVIEPRPGWQLINLRELWRYRELLLILAWRDIQVRYKQTVLGVAWAVLQPLATMVVFSLFIGRVAGAKSDGLPYPIFVFAGLLPWFLFANSVVAAAQSVVTNQSLVTKVFFPRLLIPLASVGPFVLDFLVGLGLLAIMMIGYGMVPGWGLIAVPLLTVGLVLAAIGVGTLLSALTVRYRDFRYIVPFMIQLWMFATPAIYLSAMDAVGPRLARWLPLNPAYGLIVNFRSAVLGDPFDWYSLFVSSAVAVAALLVGCFYFRRVERCFADEI